MRASRLLRGVLVALVVGSGVGVAVSPAAHADGSVPYVDAHSVGDLTLCAKDGSTITSGRTTDKPFVWRAISPTAALGEYAAAGRTATLYGFQPRENVYPGQWSGEQLTASARYTNASYPMAQATDRDLTLADLLDTYPAQWNGLFQLRLYLGAPGVPVDSIHYATADIQVTGDRWTVLRSGNAPCSSGSAVSLEALLPASNTAGLTASPAPPGSSAPATSSTRSGAPVSASSPPRPASSVSSAAAGHAAPTPAALAAAPDGTPPADSRWWVLGVVVALAAGLVALRRPWVRARGAHASD
jgi:hypothetical protein